MIPREILKKIRQIELRTNRLVTETVAGAYHSVFKGQGMNFEEVREYQPGDEVRSIDWNVTARMNHPYVKRYVEERELTVILVVDVSGSGLFGSRVQSKRELAAEIASVLAFSAIRNNDKVGLILFTDRVEKYVPPRKGRRHVLRVIREVLFFEPRQRGTNLAAALEFLLRVARRRAIAVVISDFIEPQFAQMDVDVPAARVLEGKSTGKTAAVHRFADEPLGTAAYTALRQANRRHDVVAVRITDPYELELPRLGRIVLEDAETGDVIELNTNSTAVHTGFAARLAGFQEKLLKQLRAARIDVIQLRTDTPYVAELRKFFEAREHRRLRG